jgi:hypothetical protein
MIKLNSVLLFLLLVLVIFQIFTLRAVSSAEKRITALEKKVNVVSVAPAATAPADAKSESPVEQKP